MKRSEIAAYEFENKAAESDAILEGLKRQTFAGYGNVGAGKKCSHAELESNGLTHDKNNDEIDAELALSRESFIPVALGGVASSKLKVA